MSILSGTTGAELARAPLPDDFIAEGPLQCHFGAGYLDGSHPSVITKCKNRVGSGAFNLIATAFDFDGANLVQRWKYVRDDSGGSDYHQIRILDVDGDGKDELADGGYVIDDDGSVLYSLAPGGVVHGDRFHITDMDPNRPGLEGWGIQQDNANGLETYYYDAKTGEILRKYSNPNGAGADMGRGTVADLFPDEPGFEYFSFNGLYGAESGRSRGGGSLEQRALAELRHAMGRRRRVRAARQQPSRGLEPHRQGTQHVRLATDLRRARPGSRGDPLLRRRLRRLA